MTTIQQVGEYLNDFAPPSLAEDWDNVGLLIGAADRPVQKLMTCLTITPASADEAVERGANLIVTHHPLPFRPLKRVTNEAVTGRLLLTLIENRIAVFSPHTAFDSASRGINQRLAEAMELANIEPLVTDDELPGVGSGRLGVLDPARETSSLVEEMKQTLGVEQFRLIGDLGQPVSRVAVACGSAGQFLALAQAAGCELFVTGEASFHTCLEAQANQTSLLLLGHYASERFAVVELAAELAEQFPNLTIWASRASPIR